MEEYEGYLLQIPENQIGKIELTSKDNAKPQTVRARLNRAGKSLKLDIETKRVGNVVLFWNERKE